MQRLDHLRCLNGDGFDRLGCDGGKPSLAKLVEANSGILEFFKNPCGASIVTDNVYSFNFAVLRGHGVRRVGICWGSSRTPFLATVELLLHRLANELAHGGSSFGGASLDGGCQVWRDVEL